MRKTGRGIVSIILATVSFMSCTSSSLQPVKVSAALGMPKTLEVHIFDVGEADCSLIVTPSGKKILIDAGNTGRGAGVVIHYFQSQRISSLDYAVATNFHSECIEALSEVINALGGSARILFAAFDGGGSCDSGAFKDYIRLVGNKRKIISAGQIIDLGDGVRMKCIVSNGRTQGGLAYSGPDENALSVVLLLNYRTFDMYFGGASDSGVEPSIAAYAGDVDVYRVSNHGNATSSTQGLLDCLKPEVSVISVGYGNREGNPSSETISRLLDIKSYIYQTESGVTVPPPGKGEIANGDIDIWTDGDSYTISGPSLVSKKRLTDLNRSFVLSLPGLPHSWPPILLSMN